MNPNTKRLLTGIACSAAWCGLLLTWNSNVSGQDQKQKPKAANAHIESIQQPLYSDYRGLRIGMTATEARAKLGEPTQKADDQDFFTISEKETAQIVYDASHKIRTISIDYLGGIGAPEYKAIVGPDIQTRPDGSLYKIVWYERAGFWVSYNRTAGTVPVVTVTLQSIE